MIIIINKGLVWVYYSNLNELDIKLSYKRIYSSLDKIRFIEFCQILKSPKVHNIIVKGVQFNNLKDSEDPVELSKFYNTQGSEELLFLDISATLENRASMIPIIKKVAEEVDIPFTVGGGIKNLKDIIKFIKVGAEKVSILRSFGDNLGIF